MEQNGRQQNGADRGTGQSTAEGERWHSNVWYQQRTLQMAQQCVAPTVHPTDAQQCVAATVHPTVGTEMCGTNSAPYRWHSNVWHQQRTLQMAQQYVAPKVHSVMVSQIGQPCPAACSNWRKLIIVHEVGDTKFVYNSLLIFKYS